MMDLPLTIVADIGGTNTRVALARGPKVLRDTIRRYRNAEWDALEPVLQDYLSQSDDRPEAACVDMAGPVRDGVGQLTNLDWTVRRDSVAEVTGAHTVSILNDLQAAGHSVAHLTQDALMPLLPGTPASPQAARLVVNVGTGLNIAPVYRLNGQTLVPPSEAGHITMPLQTEDELRLMHFVTKDGETPGLEDILSGRGFERIYAWLCAEDRSGTPMNAAAIMQAFHDGDDRARRAMELFVRMMGRYAGNLALITLPFGGVYLYGGVAQHFGPYLLEMGFAEAFRDKGRFAGFMDQFPVHLMTDDYAGLTGCAAHLAELLAGQG